MSDKEFRAFGMEAYEGVHFSIRERVRQITWEEFCIYPDPAEARRNAMKRVQQEYGGLIGLIVLGVVLKLIIDFIATWIQSFYTNVNHPPKTYQPNEPGYQK